MSEHGNSFSNQNPHHLYVVEDTTENKVFKYGISDDPIEEDGLSKRLRQQVDFLNRAVGFLRFLGSVLLTNIQGRRKAKEIEDKYIDNYIDAYGERPRGNPIGGKKHKK